MPTELQLREALSSRADAVDDRVEIALLTNVYAATAEPVRSHRGRAVIAMLASAAAIVAAASFVVAQRDRTKAPAPSASSEQPAVSATPALTRTGPAVSLTPGVFDEISVTTPYQVIYDIRPEVEYLTVELPDSKHASVAAYADSTGFGSSRVHNAVSVTVADTQGLYGAVSDWPANGKPDPTTGKQDGALPSVTWQLPSGTWVLVQSDDPTKHTAASLATLADSLGVRDEPAPTRIPFVANNLPAGLTLTGLRRTVQSGVFSDDAVSLADSSGRNVTIDVGQQLQTDPLDPGLYTISSRSDGAVPVSASGEHQTQQTMDALLAALDVVPDPQHETSSWPTLQAALG